MPNPTRPPLPPPRIRPALGPGRSPPTPPVAKSSNWILPVAIVGALLVGAAITALFLWPDSSGADPDSTPSAPPGTGINLVRAQNLSCSPDTWTGPDLHVTVTLDGRKVLEGHALDEAEPLFAKWVAVTPKAGGSSVKVHVEEGEPGSARITCDVDPGTATDATFTWDGSERRETLRGAGDGAALVELVLGRPRIAPVSGITSTTGTDSVDLRWVTPGADPEFVHVARSDSGEVSATVDGATRTTSLTGLCDGLEYDIQLVAQSGAWWLGTPTSFTTDNLPPLPPRILGADLGTTQVTVQWEDPTGHDTDRYELHAGAPGFSPSAASLRATQEATPSQSHWDEQASFTLKPGDVEVKVRTVDQTGADAWSGAFGIDDAQIPETPFGQRSSCLDKDPLNPAKDYDSPAPLHVALTAVMVAALALRRRIRQG